MIGLLDRMFTKIIPKLVSHGFLFCTFFFLRMISTCPMLHLCLQIGTVFCLDHQVCLINYYINYPINHKILYLINFSLKELCLLVLMDIVFKEINLIDLWIVMQVYGHSQKFTEIGITKSSRPLLCAHDASASGTSAKLAGIFTYSKSFNDWNTTRFLCIQRASIDFMYQNFLILVSVHVQRTITTTADHVYIYNS
jgi:hypothetical protein